MAREKSPAFQYYPKDLMSDSRVLAMSAEAFGCYWWLVSICWLEESIPDDVVACGKLCKGKITTKRFTTIWPEIRACFTPDDGALRQKRLDAERGNQDDWRDQSSRGGKASAKARAARFGSANPRANQEPHGEPEREPVHEPNVNRPVHKRYEPNVNTSSSSASPVQNPPTPLAGGSPPLDPGLAAMPKTASGKPGSGLRGSQAFEWRANVPAFLHAEFRRKLGGSEQEADERLRAWYRAVADDWPDLPIGESDVRFWRARFEEWVGVAAPASPRTSAAPMPTYDHDWCHHLDRCPSRDWHNLLMAREATAAPPTRPTDTAAKLETDDVCVARTD